MPVKKEFKNKEKSDKKKRTCSKIPEKKRGAM